jgi:hypothetical protein
MNAMCIGSSLPGPLPWALPLRLSSQGVALGYHLVVPSALEDDIRKEYGCRASNHNIDPRFPGPGTIDPTRWSKADRR